MKIHYVPAGCETYLGEDKLNPKELNPEFLLTNAASVKSEKSLKEAIKLKKLSNEQGKLLLVDSGGFQLATGTSNYYNAKEIIKIQNQIGNIGFILDVPPFKKTNGTGAQGLVLDLSDSYFKECLEKTRENIIKAKDIQKDIEYYFINQGATFQQLQLWYDELIKEDKFEGISTKATTSEQLLLGLMHVENTPFTKHHILGIGSLFGSVIINYFYSKSTKKMDRVTYDSTSSLINSSGKRLIIPFQTKTISLSKYNKFCNINGYSFDDLKVNYFNFFKLNTNSLFEQNKIINSLSFNEEEFKDFFSNEKYKQFYQAIDFFFDNNKNIEKTIYKFSDIFKTKIKQSNESISLMGF